MKIVPYLFFRGDCREAFQFYAAATGGTISSITTYGESPAASHVGAEMHDRIINVALEIGGARIMGSDAPPDRAQAPGGFSISLDLPTAEEAERLFAALSDGGEVSVPFGPSFWSGCFGMFTDRFGVGWMVNGG